MRARITWTLCVLLAACAGETDQVATDHLFDRPPSTAQLSGEPLAAPLAALLSQAKVTILDEPVLRGAWQADTALWLEGGDPLWTAPTRFGVPVTAGPQKSRPGARKVTYQAAGTAVQAEVASYDLAAERDIAPRRLTLDAESRRVMLTPPPARMSWRVDVPPGGATLRFGYGLQDLGLVARAGGLEAGPAAGAGCTFRLEADGAVLWSGTVGPAQAGRFLDAAVALDTAATIHFIVDRAGPPPAGAPDPGDFPFWAEPVVDAEAPDGPPNILLILLDTLRADRLGCYGWERAHTPHLDRLAARGVRFDDTMSASAWTLPSHGSLFASLFPSQHGMHERQRLPESATTLAEVLRARGYRTAAVTEGGFVHPVYGIDRGFDRFHVVKGSKRIARTFGEARAWIGDAAGPWFAFLQTFEVHSPYMPADEWRDALVRPYDGVLPDMVHSMKHLASRRKQGLAPLGPDDIRYASDLYDAGIAMADDQVGRLLDALEQAGSLENTLVVVTSDHGEEFGDHGGFDHGSTLYQELLRVPLILHLPGSSFEGGAVADHTVHTVDIAPTLALAAGAAVPADWVGEPLSLQAPDTERPLFTPLLKRKRGQFLTAVREGPAKAIHYAPTETRKGQLLVFDLAGDPREAHDLADPAERARWESRVAELWRRFPPLGGGTTAQEDADVLETLRDLGYVGD